MAANLGIAYGERVQVTPLLASVATTTPLGSAFVNVSNAQWLTFLLVAITDTTTTVTVECCTANTTSGGATEDQINFKYRLSAALGTDTWGAITAGTTAGVAFSGASGATAAMLIDVDPAALPEGYNYVRVVIAAGSNYSAATRTATAFLVPRYGQHYIASAS